MNAPTITFRGKPEAIWFGETKRQRVKVPTITRNHCDMPAFRTSRKFGGYANSDIFPAMLARELKAMGLPEYLYPDGQLPAGVMLDTSGFLWTAKIELP